MQYNTSLHYTSMKYRPVASGALPGPPWCRIFFKSPFLCSPSRIYIEKWKIYCVCSTPFVVWFFKNVISAKDRKMFQKTYKQSWRVEAQECDCKRDRYWVRFPIEEYFMIHDDKKKTCCFVYQLFYHCRGRYIGQSIRLFDLNWPFESLQRLFAFEIKWCSCYFSACFTGCGY